MQAIEQESTATIDAPVQTTGRQPWAPGQRSNRRKATKPATTTKRALKLSIEPETFERLTIHALKDGTNISELVDRLVREHCNSWVLHAKPGVKA